MLRKERFEKLLTPYQIRQVRLRNRIVCPAHNRLLADNDGYVTDLMVASYEALARGGTAMIVVGQTSVDFPMGSALKRNVIGDDRFIPGHAELARRIHKHGCQAFVQLSHTGPAQRLGDFRLEPVSSSALSRDQMPLPSYDVARELTIAEIEDIVYKFARGAERAQKAGFDGVEVHAAHSYLINSFLSPAWNRRQDAYGCQDLISRARFAVEIIRAIKERVEHDFPVGVRINGQEWGHEKVITSEDSQGFARMLQEAGADYISVSGYGYGHYQLIHYPEQILYPEPAKEMAPLVRRIQKPGLFVPAAEAIKKVVSVPIIAVGRLGPELGEWVLEENKADLIGMVKRLIADPELPNKVAAGRLEDIAPCTACIECGSRTTLNEPVRCRINAALGRELEYVIKPTKEKKRVLVVGGGPAGMEAARVAALRGHEVVLYEKERKLGGSLPVAALVKGFEIEDLVALIHYFSTQLGKLDVKVSLGKEVTPALIETIKPDVVVIATGGIPTIPEIPGIDRHNVIKSSALHSMVKPYLIFLGPKLLRWLTKLWMPIGKRVIILSGLIAGCQLAEFLVKRGRRVIIVEESDELGTGIPERNRVRLISWLTKKGVTMLTGVRYELISDKGLTLITKEGQRQTIEADTILTAIHFRPNTGLFRALTGKVPVVHLIGDAAEPRKMIDAIDDGFRVGRTIGKLE